MYYVTYFNHFTIIYSGSSNAKNVHVYIYDITNIQEYYLIWHICIQLEISTGRK